MTIKLRPNQARIISIKRIPRNKHQAPKNSSARKIISKFSAQKKESMQSESSIKKSNVVVVEGFRRWLTQSEVADHLELYGTVRAVFQNMNGSFTVAFESIESVQELVNDPISVNGIRLKVIQSRA
jgi:hypothetical protein